VRALLLSWIGAIFALPAHATIIHVPADQPTIRAGMDAASAGDTVIVACGTYFERAIPLKSGVVLRSETGSPECVTIDAQSLSTVIVCSGVDASAKIEGFTLTGGQSTRGGGMFCGPGSSPQIVRCAFVGNTAAL
jgi:hypothetical protein